VWWSSPRASGCVWVSRRPSRLLNCGPEHA
jgi:hypothetical protein